MTLGRIMDDTFDDQQREALNLHDFFGPPNAQEPCGCDFSGSFDSYCAQHRDLL